MSQFNFPIVIVFISVIYSLEMMIVIILKRKPNHANLFAIFDFRGNFFFQIPPKIHPASGIRNDTIAAPIEILSSIIVGG